MEISESSLDLLKWEDPTGTAREDTWRLDFDCEFKHEFHGAKATGDPRFLTCHEFDEKAGMTSVIDSQIGNNQTAKDTPRSIAALLIQSIFCTLADCDDTNDAEPLCVDPTMRHVAGCRAIAIGGSVQCNGGFETEVITQSKNQKLLINLLGYPDIDVKLQHYKA